MPPVPARTASAAKERAARVPTPGPSLPGRGAKRGTTPSCGADVEGGEGGLLVELELALAGELQGGDEGGGEGRLAIFAVGALGKEALQTRPVEARAEQALDPEQRLLQRHHRAAGDDVDGGLAAGADGAVGGDEVVELGLPGRLADHPQPLGRGAEEDVAADAVAGDEAGAG